MDVVRFESSHIESCAQLFIEVFNHEPWNESWDLPTATRRLNNCFQTPGFFGLVTLIEGEIAAFALGYREQWDKTKLFYLKELCVAKAQQRTGFGAKLLQELEQQLGNEGVERMYLHTARNSPAEAFYAKQGFYISERMVMMSKKINPVAQQDF